MASHISERLRRFRSIYGGQSRSPLIPRSFLVLGNGRKITAPEANKHLKWDRMSLKIVSGLAEHNFSDYRLPFRFTSNMINSLESHYRAWVESGHGKCLDTHVTLHAKELEGMSSESRFAEFLQELATCMQQHAVQQDSVHDPSVKAEIPEPRVWNTEGANHIISDGITNQKPDLVLHDHDETMMQCFESIRAVCEITATWNRNGPPIKTTEEIIRRISGIFKMQPGRRYAYSLTMSGSHFTLAEFNRAGGWEAETHDLANPSQRLIFYRIIAGLMFSKLEYLGYDPHITYFKNVPCQIKICDLETEEETTYIILDVLYNAYGIIGRGTVVFLATHGAEFYIIKDVWHDTSRIPELEHLNKLELLKEPRLPRLISFTIPFTDGSYEYANRHLPPRAKISMDRAHIRQVMQPVGERITNFRNKIELLSVLLDVVYAIKRMGEDANLIHRDITIANILIQQDPPISKVFAILEHMIDNGLFLEGWSDNFSSGLLGLLQARIQSERRRANHVETDPVLMERADSFKKIRKSIKEIRLGLLTDMDFSVYTNQYTSTEEFKREFHRYGGNIFNARTGAVPFMAIEALRCFEDDASPDYVHTVAHDLESLFYVLLWICIYYSGPLNKAREFKKKPAKTEEWRTATPTNLADLKRGQMGDFEGTIKLVDPYFDDIKDVLWKYHEALWRRPDMSDADKYGHIHSTVTPDDIIRVLLDGIKELVDVEAAKIGSKRQRSVS